MTHPLPYTGAFVRQYDPDRFFLTLLQPAQHRAALWALIAFHQEVAKTREIVSEPTLGYMRLQWWRESLERLYAGSVTKGHEILEPLAEVIKAYDLPAILFESLINAREFDLDKGYADTLDEFKSYAFETVWPLNALILKVLGDDTEGAELVSRVYGMTGLMRAIPAQAQKGYVMIPRMLIGRDDLLLNAQERSRALSSLRQEVQEDLEKASVMAKAGFLKKQIKLCRLHLDHMQKINFDIQDSRFGRQVPFQQIRILAP